MWLFNDFFVCDSLSLYIIIGGELVRFDNAQLDSNSRENLMNFQTKCI